MSPDFLDRLVKAASATPRLKKSERNADAGFNFVSIDDYYEHVAASLFESGFFWTITELSCEFRLQPHTQELIAHYTYEFSLRSVELQENYVSQLSVPHPFMGAQTTGSAMSYAEKIYLRTLLKVVTGEPDADAHAKTQIQKDSAQAGGTQADSNYQG